MLILDANLGNAFTITIVGILIVFLLLIFLVGLAACLGFISTKTGAGASAINTKTLEPEEINEETNADHVAIAMALHLYLELHDYESDVITIKETDRRYSPWSSKIYGLKYLG